MSSNQSRNHLKKKTFCTILVLFFQFNLIFSQNKLTGKYDSKRKIFIPKNEINGKVDSLVYTCDIFNNHLSIVSIKSTDKTKNLKFGVIDTTGSFIIPPEYTNITLIQNKINPLFIFTTNFEKGILNSKGKMIYGTKNLKENFWKVDENYLNINNEKNVGLFSIKEEKLILPIEFQEHFYQNQIISGKSIPSGIYVFNEIYAICRIDNLYQIHHLKTAQKSELFKEMLILDSTKLLIKKVSNDFFITENIFENKVSKKIIDFYNQNFIFEENNNFGLIDLNENIKIKAIYEDIYFVDQEKIAVKKDTKWAFAKNSGDLLSEFKYLNVDQCNSKFLDNLFHVCKIDTSKIEMENYKEVNFGENTNAILNIIQNVSNLNQRKMLYSVIFEKYKSRNYVVVEGEKGIQLINLYNGIKPNEVIWDDIYYIPNFNGVSEYIAYRKGKKYGYQIKELKFQDVFYDLDHKYNCASCENLGVIGRNLFSYSWNYQVKNTKNAKWTYRCKVEEYIPNIMKNE